MPRLPSVLNVKELEGAFNYENALVTSRGILHICEIFAKVRWELYTTPSRSSDIHLLVGGVT